MLSKFRTILEDEKLLDTSPNISNVKIGSFIELEGELQKNPLIDYMDKIVDMFRMVDIFSDEPELGNKKNVSLQKKKENQILKQIKEFSAELKHSGTVDFILSGSIGTIVLSAQEQYLANDNISEILGGKFKVLGKVIAICKDDSESIDLFDSPLLLFRNNGLTYRQMFVKRAMDIAISLAGILISSPVMLLIAAFVKWYDHGPVFYRQKRLTKDGQEFEILKFRSMVVNSEKHGARLAKKNDSRITPIGRVIRRLHFDELPQLFNILKGDMAFVGPRPERREITDEYAKAIPEFPYRLKVKAGLTGYAQVYGQYNTVPYDKLKMDLTYITSYSVWLDIKLIILTVKILFQKEKSEGVKDTQKTALKK